MLTVGDKFPSFTLPVQQGVSVTEALIRLRAYTFSNDRLLADVAQDVIARRLRLQ